MWYFVHVHFQMCFASFLLFRASAASLLGSVFLLSLSSPSLIFSLLIFSMSKLLPCCVFPSVRAVGSLASKLHSNMYVGLWLFISKARSSIAHLPSQLVLAEFNRFNSNTLCAAGCGPLGGHIRAIRRNLIDYKRCRCSLQNDRFGPQLSAQTSGCCCGAAI